MFWAMYTRCGKCSAAYSEIGPICGTYGDTFKAIGESKRERLDLLLHMQVRPVHEHRRTADHLDVLIAEAKRLQVVPGLLTPHSDRG